jgi:hypothetical protein
MNRPPALPGKTLQRAPRRLLTLAFCMSFAFSTASLTAQQPDYLNTQLTPQSRAHDLVSRMTLEEKASQLEDWAPAIPRLGIPDYQTWNEALHGVARAGYATVFPQAIGMAATWDPKMSMPWGHHLHRSPRKVQPGAKGRQSPHLLRPHLLVAQHQHLSRSALGTWPGDLRRRPVPYWNHGCSFRHRRAGQRSRPSQGCSHQQALCRA